MKIAVYPGSFNPWHKGHVDVLDKALAIFDMVYVLQAVNTEKEYGSHSYVLLEKAIRTNFPEEKVKVTRSFGLLVDVIKELKANAVIKGLRNGQDLEYERAQQYWNEDLGLVVPIVYVISDRNLTHISSSAIRSIEKLKASKE